MIPNNSKTKYVRQILLMAVFYRLRINVIILILCPLHTYELYIFFSFLFFYIWKTKSETRFYTNAYQLLYNLLLFFSLLVCLCELKKLSLYISADRLGRLFFFVVLVLYWCGFFSQIQLTIMTYREREKDKN